MCGLFGFNGWNKANVAKLKMLGLYNKSRGHDSCGYYFNEKLVKGTGKLKEFDDFIEEIIIDEKGKGNVFIGHTRWSTVGANTEENAHPFKINDRKIVAHNGTLENHWELCDKYGIDRKDLKVDSQALGTLIDQEGFRILDEYRGYAALLIHNINEPDSLYAYHGASKLEQNAQKMTEERPLFLMQTKEGVYFSSLQDSLLAIRDDAKQLPIQVVHNHVYKFTNGKLGKNPIKINREWNNVDLEKKTYVTYPRVTMASTQQTGGGTVRETSTNMSVIGTKPSDNNGFGTAIISKEDQRLDIWNETYPPRCFDITMSDYDYLFYYMGRFWHTDENTKAHGCILLDKKGIVCEEVGNDVYERYFFDGIMLRGKKDWDDIQIEINENRTIGCVVKNKGKYNYAMAMSRFAKYPITNLPDEADGLPMTVRKMWYLDLKPAVGGVTLPYADRNYTFKMGALVKIVPNHSKDIYLSLDPRKEWVNHPFFSKLPKGDLKIVRDEGFEDAEIIEMNTDKKYAKEIVALAKYFDTNYKDEDTVCAEVPATVFEAIRLYLVECTETQEYVPSTEELDHFVQQFISTAVNDGITFRDSMANGYPSAEEYLQIAYLQEIADDENESEEKAEVMREIDEEIQRLNKTIKDEKEVSDKEIVDEWPFTHDGDDPFPDPTTASPYY